LFEFYSDWCLIMTPSQLAQWLELPYGSEKLQIMFDADDAVRP
jgi:hypothetical protein